MKSISNYILEANRKNIIRPYNKSKNLNLKDLEEKLNEKLPLKDFSIFIENETDKITLDITRNFKEGIIGHPVEDIIAATIIKLNLPQFNIKIEKKDGADLEINGEAVEVKAFNRVIEDDGHIKGGIKFKDNQIKNEFPMILIHYNINDQKIKIDKVYCRYPDEVYWGDSHVTGLIVKNENK